jgi:hypothetical protein
MGRRELKPRRNGSVAPDATYRLSMNLWMEGKQDMM